MSDNQNLEPPAVTPPPPPAATPPPPAMQAATPPPTPPAALPPPVGPPTGQPGYPPAYSAYPAAQTPGLRSMGKFVTGIILTIIGGLWTLASLGNVAIAARAFGDNPGYVSGRLIGGFVFPIALLIVGIILIRTSKSKVQ